MVFGGRLAGEVADRARFQFRTVLAPSPPSLVSLLRKRPQEFLCGYVRDFSILPTYEVDPIVVYTFLMFLDFFPGYV